MASALVDLVKIVANTTGTGAIRLGVAVDGYRGIENLSNGVIYSYSIQQGAAWEYGRGTYLSSGNLLVRAPIATSNGGTPINLTQNAVVAFVVLAEDLSAVTLTAQVQAAASAVLAATTTLATVPLNSSGAVLVGNLRYSIRTSGGNLDPILPAISVSPAGTTIEIQDIDFLAATNNQVIHVSGADTIVFEDVAPASTFTMTLSGVCLRFISNGTYWRAIYYGA